MRILAVDTSTARGTAAVLDDETCLRSETGGIDARHGETLLPLVERVCRAAETRVEELALVCVGVGPGSFTGTRIGVATAKGLGLALGIPIVGVSSLEAVAEGAGVLEVAVVFDAGRGKVYAARFGSAPLTPFEAPPDQARLRLAKPGLSFVGSGVRKYPTISGDARVLGVEKDTPDAFQVGLVGLRRFRLEGPSANTLEPHYVRPSDAKLPA